MSVMDFLFEGKPPQSVTTYGTTSQNIPQWLSDYTQGLISRANSIAAEPYQPYPGPRLAGLTPQQMSAYDLANQIPGTADYAQSALNMPGALQSAAPYIAGAAQTFPGSVDQYMDPYIDNVLNRNSEMANRALTEQFLPEMEDQFSNAGQFGSSRMQELDQRGVRDITEGLQDQNNAYLSQAYTNAGQMFGADASRMGALASSVGSMAGSDKTTQANIAQLMQQMQLTGAGALESAGAAQQGQTQKSEDLAYQDYLTQLGYPKEQAEWMANMIHGIPYSSTATTSSTGPSQVYQPSPLSQLASMATAGMGLYNTMYPPTTTGHARGGALRILRFARGGKVTRLTEYPRKLFSVWGTSTGSPGAASPSESLDQIWHLLASTESEAKRKVSARNPRFKARGVNPVTSDDFDSEEEFQRHLKTVSKRKNPFLFDEGS